MNGSEIGLIGGLIGGGVGMLGGLFGTYMSWRRASSSRERRFILKFAVAVWFIVLAYLPTVFLLHWIGALVSTVVYLAILVPACFWANRRLKVIHGETIHREA